MSIKIDEKDPDIVHVRGQRYSLRRSMAHHAKSDPRWAKALAAYDSVPTKPKARPKAKSKARVTPGVMSVEAFAALDPVMAAAFKLAPAPAQQARLEGNLFYLGDPGATPAAPKAAPAP